MSALLYLQHGTETICVFRIYKIIVSIKLSGTCEFTPILCACYNWPCNEDKYV